jgi:hypothetical protein
MSADITRRNELKRTELPKQIVPVVFDPILCELLALKPTDHDRNLTRPAKCSKVQGLTIAT